MKICLHRQADSHSGSPRSHLSSLSSESVDIKWMALHFCTLALGYTLLVLRDQCLHQQNRRALVIMLLRTPIIVKAVMQAYVNTFTHPVLT